MQKPGFTANSANDMTDDIRHRAESLFHAALDLQAEDRSRFLDQSCGDDNRLRHEVESLLAHNNESFLEVPLAPEAVQLLTSKHRESLIGKTVDHYKIEAWIGAGGMGEVYRAADLRLGRRVALKLLLSAFTSDENRVRLFHHEARAASSLNHPNIITVHDIGQSDSLHFIAMEFIQGDTLRQKLRGGVRIPLSEAIKITIQIANALADAHRAGIIHRDIKPENVMIGDSGIVKVLDFGIAKLREQPEQEPVLDQTTPLSAVETSLVGGTASYMSPEQARGESLDTRSDMFSLGILLYEIITGRRPFENESPAETLRAIINDDPPPISDLRRDTPPSLAEILKRALAKNRDERYQSATEVIADLESLKTELDSQRRSEILSPQIITDRPRRLRLSAKLVRLLEKKTARADSLNDTAAFRGLASFSEDDRDCFYGRERDTSALFERIARDQFRFGVFYGDSGAGKTSLITAGLMPRLKEVGFLTAHSRSYKDPLAAVIDECHRQSGVCPLESEPPVDYLKRVVEETGKQIVIICDQFEEFFVNFRTRREREPFISFVVACYGTNDLPVKFLFSIRSDFLHLISSEFDGRIPEPLMGERRYHLRNLDQDQAEEIIEKTARQSNLPLDSSLCRRAASDLAAGESVLPSELQIVGEQLQRKRIFTLREYQRAGGKEQLVNSFLEEIVEQCEDQQAARILLRSLISEKDTRLTLSAREIIKRTQRSRETAEKILRLFVESRLIREIQEDEPWRYELMHEYLIEKINRITGRVMDTTQRANRLFRQYLSNFSVDHRTRVPLNKLWFIRKYSDMERGEREQELLKKSWRWGIAKWSVSVVLIWAVMILGAAWLSISEEWDETILRDGHTKAVRQVAFSPDGHLLVSVSEDSQVIVWDFARREKLAVFADHNGTVCDVAFSVDGRWFATDGDGIVIVWDAKRLEKVATLPGQSGMSHTIAFTPDGKFLITPTGSDSLNLWVVGEWEKSRRLNTVGFVGGQILLSPDGRKLSNQWWNTWDLATGKLVIDEATPMWAKAAMSSDANSLVTVDSSGTVDFWNINQLWKTRKRELKHRDIAHQERGRAVAYSPDGRYVASGGEEIILWDAVRYTKLTRLEHTAVVMSLAFSPDGRFLVSAHGDGAILVWDVLERERCANFNEHSAPVQSVGFSQDGKYVASASEDRSVIIWNAENRTKEAVLTGHQSRVSAVTISSDGTRAASSDLYGEVILWDLAECKPILKAPPPQRMSREFNHCIAMSPDDRWIVTSFGVYDSSKGRLVVDLRIRKDPLDIYGVDVFGVSFSPDGRWLACVTVRSVVSVWEVETWQLRQSYELVGTTFASVCFSPDSKWLVTGDEQGVVRLWQIEPLQNTAVLGYHSDTVTSVAFSPDSSEVVSASEDKTIALWNVRGRRLIDSIGTHSAPVLSVAFSPDGKRLVSGEHDRTVRLYTRHRALWGYRLD